MTAQVGDRLEQFTGGQAIEVDVPAIERELSALWRAASAEGKGLTRACLWNLVVRCDSGESYRSAERLVDAIVPVSPARVLLLDLAGTRAEDAPIAAWIRAQCHLAPGGGKLVCSEEVVLRANGEGRSLLPSLVRALLVPDVPVAFWWRSDALPDAAEVARFDTGAERVIADGDAYAGPGGLGGFAVLARGVLLVDMAWLRLAPVRVLLAGLFDPPVGPGPLRCVSLARVRSCAHGARGGQLLLGWLAASLGWARPEAAGEGRWRVSRPGGAVDLALEVTPCAEEGHGLVSVTLVCGDASFALARAGAEAFEVRAGALPPRVVAVPARTEAELLVAALGQRGHDPLFPLALARAAELDAARL